MQQIQALVKNGDIQQAWNLLQKIAESDYDQQAYYLAAVCNRYLNNPNIAHNYITKLLHLNAKHARAYQEQAYNYLLLQQTEKAQFALLTALKINPSLVSAWRKLAEIYQITQQDTLADNAMANAEYYQNLPLHIRSGYSKFYEGDIAAAQGLCQNFLQQQPDNIDGMRLLAQIASTNQHFDKAEFLLESTLLLEPNNIYCQYDLTLVLQHRQKLLAAFDRAQSLLQTSPDNLSFLLCFANQAAAINKFNEAESAYQQVLNALPKHSPERAQVLIALGHLYKTLGRSTGAEQCYKQAYKSDNCCADAYWSLANLKRYQFSHEELQLMLDTLEQQPLTILDKCLLSFALAKAFELRENYQRAACFYQSANHLRLSDLDYDNQQHAHNIKQQASHFPAHLFENHAAKNVAKTNGKAGITPIFIVGLPRAGSTLLEQILASHSQIQGTMELPNIMQIAHELEQKASDQKIELAEYISGLTATQLSELGERYLDETSIHHHNARFFIDKMPNNFKHIGLIKLILPHAKIIDIRRNIKDACMANYKQYFAQGQAFSYNLRHCANFYHAYCELMSYWRKVSPNNLLLVEYEKLVAEPQASIQPICEMLGVEFEPTMLDFYQNTRAVKTPSAEQVRQPIYNSSVDSWRVYASYLPELHQL